MAVVFSRSGMRMDTRVQHLQQFGLNFFLDFDTVELSFLFNKHYPLME